MPNRDGTGPAGRGRGLRGNAGRGIGAGGYCICPKCGYRIRHTAGVPCTSLKCPKCKTPLVRE